MTKTEITEMFRQLTKETDDVTSEYYLELAKSIVINKAYPFDATVNDVPARYVMNQIEIAVYLYNKAGAEGELTHNENGVNRTYESADVPSSMLKGIVPFVGFIGEQ